MIRIKELKLVNVAAKFGFTPKVGFTAKIQDVVTELANRAINNNLKYVTKQVGEVMGKSALHSETNAKSLS